MIILKKETILKCNLTPVFPTPAPKISFTSWKTSLRSRTVQSWSFSKRTDLEEVGLWSISIICLKIDFVKMLMVVSPTRSIWSGTCWLAAFYSDPVWVWGTISKVGFWGKIQVVVVETDMASFTKRFFIIVKSCWLAQLSACEKNQVPEAFSDQIVAVFWQYS